jgi:hypothetical protein
MTPERLAVWLLVVGNAALLGYEINSTVTGAAVGAVAGLMLAGATAWVAHRG